MTIPTNRPRYPPTTPCADSLTSDKGNATLFRNQLWGKPFEGDQFASLDLSKGRGGGRWKFHPPRCGLGAHRPAA